MQRQLKMQHGGNSGMSHISSLRSGLSRIFQDAGIKLDDLTLKVLSNWMKSRGSDDMEAKTRERNRVSVARNEPGELIGCFVPGQ